MALHAKAVRNENTDEMRDEMKTLLKIFEDQLTDTYFGGRMLFDALFNFPSHLTLSSDIYLCTLFYNIHYYFREKSEHL